MLFLILKYYAAIAANWYVCSEEIETAQSGDCILYLLFASCCTRALRVVRIVMDKMMRGDFWVVYTKRKISPDVLNDTERMLLTWGEFKKETCYSSNAAYSWQKPYC